jgi:uncharacterized membrane protein YeaQ/YmgE (transglycosylase-associated protein family)
MQLLCITILIGASGFVLTIMVGIAGALAAAFFGQLLHWYEPGQLAGFAGTIAGAAILLAGYHVLARER